MIKFLVAGLLSCHALMAQFSLDSLQEAVYPDFSGQIILKTKNGNLDMRLTKGVAHRNWDIAMTDSAVMDMASLNKSFIANLVLQAAQEGKWRLEEDLNLILERLSVETRFAEGLTLHQMLTHCSGLPNYGDLPESWKAANLRRFKKHHFKDNRAYLEFIAEQEAKLPGKQFYYSNFAYHILVILLEELYGEDFNAILKAKIAVPLGMNSLVSPKARNQIVKHLAPGYMQIDGLWQQNSYIDLSLGRRIFCNASDLLKWLEAEGGAQLLHPDYAELVFENHAAEVDTSVSYGYGWVPYKSGQYFKMGDLDLNVPYFIHGGSTEGYQSMAVSIRKGQTYLLILSNSGNGPKIFELTKAIVHAIYSN